jgi:hypothetical protein
MKKTLQNLIAITALMLISSIAMAQGGTDPYVGSAHDYTVVPGNASNDLSWTVNGATSGTGFIINSGGTASTVNIYWTAPGTYTLRLLETDANLCSTEKQMTITVSSQLEVSTSDPTKVCNSAVDTTTPSLNVTSIDFVVSMATGVSAWSPNWEITFTVAGGTGSPTIGSVTSTDGTLTDNGGGSYTLTAISSTSGAGSATISVDVAGNAFSDLTAVLTITAAKELQYSTTDTDSGDWGATQSINPIPNTSAITTD